MVVITIQLECVAPLAVPHGEYTLEPVHYVARIHTPGGRDQCREMSKSVFSPEEALWIDFVFQGVKRS